MTGTKTDREAAFQEARAGVLAWRLRLAERSGIVLNEHGGSFALRFAGNRPDVPIGAVAVELLRLADGNYTVGEIIDVITGEMGITEAVIAGKAAMAALHQLYVEGMVEELEVR